MMIIMNIMTKTINIMSNQVTIYETKRNSNIIKYTISEDLGLKLSKFIWFLMHIIYNPKFIKFLEAYLLETDKKDRFNVNSYDVIINNNHYMIRHSSIKNILSKLITNIYSHNYNQYEHIYKGFITMKNCFWSVTKVIDINTNDRKKVVVHKNKGCYGSYYYNTFLGNDTELPKGYIWCKFCIGYKCDMITDKGYKCQRPVKNHYDTCFQH